MMDSATLLTSLGFQLDSECCHDQTRLRQYINLKLTAMGYPASANEADADFLEIARPLLQIHEEKTLILGHVLCPADQRIQDWLDDYLAKEDGDAGRDPVCLPNNTFMLDRHGLARTMSLPASDDEFVSPMVSSYRVRQGVLHNPKEDRRTTAGAFHVAEGGLPIPDDKNAVPKEVFAKLLAAAFDPPEDDSVLPMTSRQADQAKLFVTLLLRPTVCPEVPGILAGKSLEIRFFAPASLVSNLDFVESIFGNAGNPFLPENNAAYDVEHWTGHSGCVVLAPHVTTLRKKELGLPRWEDATERQRRDGMAWAHEDELYNDGHPFKVTARDARGVIVTIIADNYFGYCKKEVKTQISFSANLYGLAEEEHSGGAIAFPAENLGHEFRLDRRAGGVTRTFRDVAALFGSLMDVRAEGYGVDKRHPRVLYLPEDALFDLVAESISWEQAGVRQSLKLSALYTYVLPSGYKVSLQKHVDHGSWRLIGQDGEGTLCHKPCTVSGGGKSEISKSLQDSMLQGPLFVVDFQKDMDAVDEITGRAYGDQFRDPALNDDHAKRPILSELRSLGSVIALLTPSVDFTDSYNAWLDAIPPHVKDIVFAVKRHFRPDWGSQWRDRFGVDIVNGNPGHELKLGEDKLVAQYVRVGHEKDGAWRVYKLRLDFSAADKLQVADDISVSVVVPAERLDGLNPTNKSPSVKFVHNCEYRLFQRPDECVNRGYDKQAEAELSSPGVFLSNFRPLSGEQAQEIVDDVMGFDDFSEPVRKLLLDFVNEGRPSFVVSSAHPRLVDGEPSKNPRYLQDRHDLLQPHKQYVAEIGVRFARSLPLEQPLHLPVDAVLAGRRNNPPDRAAGIPPLAVYNPIHYQELPELFMDFACSVTGRSPSTTGFGSEGALTKGPFNALWPVVDLNNALVSFILTGADGFSSAAGHVGPHVRVGHDISILIPEIWCRMSVDERSPRYLIASGCLERMADIERGDRKVLASRLGYRITSKFVRTILGRIFSNPIAVFSDEMLQPERQDEELFFEGIDNIVATQKLVAEHYFADGSVEAACPPLKALIHIMAKGHFEGKDVHDPEIRALFSRESLLASAWYRERLRVFRTRETALWTKHVKTLEDAASRPNMSKSLDALGLPGRLIAARSKLESLQDPTFLDSLVGTLGADPFHGQLRPET